MWHISDFNKDTDEFLVDRRYIHRELCVRTKSFWGRDKARFYHYLYEVMGNGNLYPVTEAISDREYAIALRVLWSGIHQSPLGQQKEYESNFGY